MTYFRFLLVLSLFCCGSAVADIWKWVDVHGDTHFVNTSTAIFTWLDESGKVNYSDTPDHEDAVAVVLIWHSKGNLVSSDEPEPAAGGVAEDGIEFAGETREQRAEREAARAHDCKRAIEIYDSYVNAPRLYKTNDEGEREYLSKKEIKTTIAETKDKVHDLCK